jgi:glycosyltransferase involved in cell wall biosynthesis
MKLFILGVPFTQTTLEFTTCPFTMKAWNWCRMFRERGHEVIHLGVEGSDPDCCEHVSVVDRDYWRRLYGHPGTKPYNTRLDGEFEQYHAHYAANVINAIRERVDKPYEAIVCATWAGGQEIAAKTLDQFVIEAGIGYRHTWAKYRVFISYAWMHFHFGLEGRIDGNRWYDVVIPNPIDPQMFDYRPDAKQDYFLFLGRLNDDKGAAVAIDVAKRVGRKILIVGPGEPERFLAGNPHAEYLPPVGVEQRRKLMSEAAAFLCPTQYIEPFGNVALEAQISGTPVICTDWGGFSENVQHGFTGYRCRTMEQFVWAANNIDHIRPEVCREWVLNNYSMNRIRLMFEEYFQSVLDLGRGGWYEERPERNNLDWLQRSYPV